MAENLLGVSSALKSLWNDIKYEPAHVKNL